MKQRFWTKNLSAMSITVGAMMLVAGPVARADILYRWDNGSFTERFNDSAVDETEDNWVANAFTVVDGGTRLLSIEYPLGETFSNQPVTVVIYRGISDTDPCAGGGLVELRRTAANISGAQGDNVTIPLSEPVDLNVGDVFYAAILIRNVPGTLFPFFNDGNLPLGHSFFDVGYYRGGPYDLDVQHFSITVNGGVHPVVDGNVQSPGSTFLRVNATTTP